MAAAKVLFVDDEEEMVRVMEHRLAKRDFDVTTALSGDEALQRLDSSSPDVVILDVFMPGLSGIDTLKQIKSKKPLTEVIMLSGNATMDLAVEGMQNGAFDFLIKPVNIGELVEKINRAHARRMEHEERIRKADLHKEHPSEPGSRGQPASPDGSIADLPKDRGRLLVLGGESDFSRELMDYALNMSRRMSYSIVALNAAGFDRESFKLFPAARERVLKDFQEVSDRNGLVFQKMAEKMGVPFAHLVKFCDQDDAIAETVEALGGVDYVVSEAEDVEGQILAYCPM